MDDESFSQCVFECAMEAFSNLFENQEHFYCAYLLSDGEGRSPFISAWSLEALDRLKAESEQQKRYYEWVKWSYADSPYVNFSGDSFSRVGYLLAKRPGIDQLSVDEWIVELDFRFREMEAAMRMLDEYGIFSRNQPRNEILINVEIVPPDYSNTLRAKRLNSEANLALAEWLVDAAEMR